MVEQSVAISAVYKLSSIACIIPGFCNCVLICVKSIFKKTDMIGNSRKEMYVITISIRRAIVVLSTNCEIFDAFFV
jgi:hypothetical protein